MPPSKAAAIHTRRFDLISVRTFAAIIVAAARVSRARGGRLRGYMPHGHLRRRDFLMGLAGLSAVAASRSTSSAQTARAAAAPAFMYVGSFTSEGRGHGEGISVFQRKENRWSLVQVVKELADPSFV